MSFCVSNFLRIEAQNEDKVELSFLSGQTISQSVKRIHSHPFVRLIVIMKHFPIPVVLTSPSLIISNSNEVMVSLVWEEEDVSILIFLLKDE